MFRNLRISSDYKCIIIDLDDLINYMCYLHVVDIPYPSTLDEVMCMIPIKYRDTFKSMYNTIKENLIIEVNVNGRWCSCIVYEGELLDMPFDKLYEKQLYIL